jgi:hypothetical protein
VRDNHVIVITHNNVVHYDARLSRNRSPNLSKLNEKDLAVVLHHLNEQHATGLRLEDEVAKLQRQLIQQVDARDRVTLHTSHVTRHTSHVTRHTL